MPKNTRLRTARQAKVYTQEDLAKIVGVTRQTIGLIESGKYNSTLNLCLSICHALDASLDVLFWEENENETHTR